MLAINGKQPLTSLTRGLLTIFLAWAAYRRVLRVSL